MRKETVTISENSYLDMIKRILWIKSIPIYLAEKQIEEKKMKELKNTAVKEEETWADKLGQSHRKLPFPEQPKDTTSGMGDPYASGGEAVSSVVPGLESNRVQSAPEKDIDDR